MKRLAYDKRTNTELLETARGYIVKQETEFYTLSYILERKSAPNRDMRKHDLLDAEREFDKLCKK